MSTRKITAQENFRFKYSICTLATNLTEYGEMVSSFLNAGFKTDDCEYMYSDNSKSNELEAYGGINRFLREARGEFVIICHQDVLINIDDRAKLEDQINIVNIRDPNWGVLGNAGIKDMYNMSMKYTNEHLEEICQGNLPSQVQSLDENFLLVKASANLAVAGNLKGFHMYGTDICLVAECLGYSAFAIDFNIIHKGRGKVDASFHQLSEKIQKKYSLFFRGRYVRSTITRFYLSPNWVINSLMNLGFMKNIIRLYYKLAYKIKSND